MCLVRNNIGWGGAISERSRSRLKILFAVVGAHRNQRRRNDHRQKNYGEDEIVNHCGTSYARHALRRSLRS